MSDELGPLVTSVTFLTVFSLIVTMLPAGVLVGYVSGGIPTMFDIPASTTFADSTYFQLNDTMLEATTAGREHYYTLSGISYGMFVADYDGEYQYLEIARHQYFGSWITSTYNLVWVNPDGVTLGYTLTRDQLNYDWSHGDTTQANVHYTVRLGTLLGFVTFAFNASVFATPWEAFVNETLWAFHGVGVNDTSSRMAQSGLPLLLSILTWSNPSIHPLLNGILAAPIYVTLVYLAYVLFTKLIP